MGNKLIIMENKNDIEQLPTSKKKETRKEVSKPFLERFLGKGSSFSKRIAAFLLIILVLAGILYTFMPSARNPDKLMLSVKDFWGILTPLILSLMLTLFGGSKGGGAA